MSEEVLEVILVGGSKDGTIAEGSNDTKAINNIVLDETKENVEYVDLYMPTNVTDKEGRPVYAHIGRYDATESASYWATLSQEEKDALKEAAEAAEKAAEEARVAEEQQKADEAADEPVEEAKEDEKVTEEVVSQEEAKPDEPVVEDKAAGEVTEESGGAGSDDSKPDQTTDEVVEVEEEKAE